MGHLTLSNDGSKEAHISKATTEALSELHGVIATELTRRIQSNEASAADIGAAIKFLKDNSITVSVEDDQKMHTLREKLESRARKRSLRLVTPSPDAPLTPAESEGITRSA